MKYKTTKKLFGYDLGLIFEFKENGYCANLPQGGWIGLPRHIVENRPEFEKVEDDILEEVINELMAIGKYTIYDTKTMINKLKDLQSKIKEDEETINSILEYYKKTHNNDFLKDNFKYTKLKSLNIMN